MLCQKGVELVGKGVGIFASECLWPLGHLSALSDTLHEVAYGKVLFDILGSVELPSVVYGMRTLCDDPVCQRDVGSDDQITVLTALDDLMVSLIRLALPMVTLLLAMTVVGIFSR